MAKTKTIGQLARDTHDVLEERGWCTGDFEKADGRVCLMGGANVAAYGKSDPDLFGMWKIRTAFRNEAVDALADGFALADIPGYGIGRGTDSASKLYGWNDSRISADEVKNALLQVAEACADVPCRIPRQRGR